MSLHIIIQNVEEVICLEQTQVKKHIRKNLETRGGMWYIILTDEEHYIWNIVIQTYSHREIDPQVRNMVPQTRNKGWYRQISQIRKDGGAHNRLKQYADLIRVSWSDLPSLKVGFNCQIWYCHRVTRSSKLSESHETRSNTALYFTRSRTLISARHNTTRNNSTISTLDHSWLIIIILSSYYSRTRSFQNTVYQIQLALDLQAQ